MFCLFYIQKVTWLPTGLFLWSLDIIYKNKINQFIFMVNLMQAYWNLITINQRMNFKKQFETLTKPPISLLEIIMYNNSLKHLIRNWSFMKVSFYEKIWNNFSVGDFILDYVCEWWRRILVKIINRCGTAQKITFSIRIPSVNVTKSAVSCEFGKSLIENFILSAVWMAPLKFLSQDLTPFLISMKIFINSLNQNLNFLKKT